MLQEPGDKPPTLLAGSYRLTRVAGAEGLALTSSSANGRIEILFHGVATHDLPAQLRNPTLEATVAPGSRAAPARRHVFAVRAENGSWRVEATSMQVHEHVSIFGRAVPLARFALRKRMLWTLLLWMARFGWGRTVIARLTSRGR